MDKNEAKCIVCEGTSQEVPLIALEYKDQRYYICPQHFPILIHKPESLIGKLPGAEKLIAQEH
ncbi:MAG: hypothetical protein WCI88_00535 [Chloroflexota bacterium]